MEPVIRHNREYQNSDGKITKSHNSEYSSKQLKNIILKLLLLLFICSNSITL
jgi:hypothetical protein